MAKPKAPPNPPEATNLKEANELIRELRAALEGISRRSKTDKLCTAWELGHMAKRAAQLQPKPKESK